jgi:hypothetical protein
VGLRAVLLDNPGRFAAGPWFYAPASGGFPPDLVSFLHLVAGQQARRSIAQMHPTAQQSTQLGCRLLLSFLGADTGPILDPDARSGGQP